MSNPVSNSTLFKLLALYTGGHFRPNQLQSVILTASPSAEPFPMFEQVMRKLQSAARNVQWGTIQKTLWAVSELLYASGLIVRVGNHELRWTQHNERFATELSHPNAAWDITHFLNDVYLAVDLNRADLMQVIRRGLARIEVTRPLDRKIHDESQEAFYQEMLGLAARAKSPKPILNALADAEERELIYVHDNDCCVDWLGERSSEAEDSLALSEPTLGVPGPPHPERSATADSPAPSVAGTPEGPADDLLDPAMTTSTPMSVRVEMATTIITVDGEDTFRFIDFAQLTNKLNNYDLLSEVSKELHRSAMTEMARSDMPYEYVGPTGHGTCFFTAALSPCQPELTPELVTLFREYLLDVLWKRSITRADDSPKYRATLFETRGHITHALERLMAHRTLLGIGEESLAVARLVAKAASYWTKTGRVQEQNEIMRERRIQEESYRSPESVSLPGQRVNLNQIFSSATSTR